MVVAIGRARVLFASLLVLMSMKDITVHSQDLELAFDRELTFRGTHDPCGHLTCRVRGNSLTLESVSVTEVKATQENRHVLTVSSTKPNEEISETDIRGNGTFRENNRATLNFDLLDSSICTSGYFICEVVYTKRSGERERQFATAGPGYPPRVYPPAESGISSSNSHNLGQCTSNDKVNEVKFESLEKRLSQMYDTIMPRVSTLEDKFFSLLLQKSPVAGPNATKTLENLEMRMSDVEQSIENPHTQDEHFEPQICAPGMGDDVTKEYPPYIIMNQTTIRKQVLCDTHTLGGGWLMIQRRAKGDVDFYRDWTAYREGFGHVTGDFWLGLEAIHTLTDEHPYELRIDFRLDGQEKFAQYSSFRVESESDKYRLRLGSYSGTIREAANTGLSYSNNTPFTTFDRDNDASSTNCAISHHAGWWYGSCHRSNLNGIWKKKAYEGVSWYTGSAWVHPSYTEMKIRRVQPSTSG
ncbi:ficolin-2 [Elysia marginata]|uniref:Ficolin-2 n=1 Tax=Elysia marginata TaxID=1093978 RepID=A0AAV4J838_9GAST|nr:ficolin-2 [Elysia marginata]